MGFVIGPTVTGGIQDVSALLPLLGTEQCEGHVGSALDNGFLYASAASMSTFGSLGLVKAGFKAAIAGACFGFRSRTFVGAKKLAEAGFEPVGKAMSLIQWDGKRHKAESRFIELLEELDPRDLKKLTVESKTRQWNLYMLLTSLLVIVLSFSPYVYFIELSRKEPLVLRWIFPIARSFGSLLTATMIQLVIQTRILQIVKYRLVFMTVQTEVKQNQPTILLPPSWSPQNPSEKALYDLERQLRSGDEEDGHGALKAALDGAMEAHLPSATRTHFRWILIVAQIAILIGMLLSLVGYIGCFSLVQNSQTSVGPLIWLGCEVGLSLLRLGIWSWNPKWDDCTSLSLSLRLSPESQIPICTMSTEACDETMTVPLKRAREFLDVASSCVGFVAPLHHSTGVVYYALARSMWTAKRTLFVVIHNSKENLTRMYIRRPSSYGSKPTIEIRFASVNDHDVSTIGDLIPKQGEDQFVAEFPGFFQNFEKHCDSILQGRAPDVESAPINLSWELKASEEDNKVLPVDEDVRNSDGPHRLYVSTREVEQAAVDLNVKRGNWIENYVDVVMAEEDRCTPATTEDDEQVPSIEGKAAEVLMLSEWFQMEKDLAAGTLELETVLRQRSANLRSHLQNETPDVHFSQSIEREHEAGAATRLAAAAVGTEARLKKLRERIKRRQAFKDIDLLHEPSEVEQSIKDAWKTLREGRDPSWNCERCIATPSRDDPLAELLSGMPEDAKERTREGEARMRDRLGAERRKMDAQIEKLKRAADFNIKTDRAFVSECTAFRGSDVIANLSVAKFVRIDYDDVTREGIAAICEALEENPFVTVIDWWSGTAADTIKVIKALKKAKNVSLYLPYRVDVLHWQGPLAQELKEALELHQNVVSLGQHLGGHPALEEVIKKNRTLAYENDPLVFYEHVLALPGYVSFYSDGRCVVRFPSRDGGEWTLHLTHQFGHEKTMIEIKLNGEDLSWGKEERPIARFGRQEIKVKPLNSEGHNELTIQTRGEGDYRLSDIRLLRKDNDARLSGDDCAGGSH